MLGNLISSVCLVVSSDQVPEMKPHVFLWINVLIGAIIAAIAATIIDNVVKGMNRERAHNSLLLANECLAEHQSAYVVYFIALLGTTEFSRYWAKPILPEVLFVAFVIYVIAVAVTTTQDSVIVSHHHCGDKCNRPLPARVKWHVVRWNVFFSMIMFIAAIVFAILSTRAPG